MKIRQILTPSATMWDALRNGGRFVASIFIGHSALQEIDNYHTEQIPLYGNNLCMNEIHFRYTKNDSTTAELLKIAEEKNAPLDCYLNALKNLTMRYPEDKNIDINNFCELLIKRVESPINLIDRRVAIQCLCHISSIITPNTPLHRTMSIDKVKTWWNKYKTRK